MRDETGVDGDRVVGVVSAERGPAVDDESAHGRTESGRRKLDRWSQRRILDAGDTGERVADDVELQAGLGGRCHVLPAAAAAAVAREFAWRDDSVGRRVEHLDDPGAEMVGSVRRDLGPHTFAGQRAVDEGNASVVGAGKRVPARYQPCRREFHGVSVARSLRDSDTVRALRVHELGKPEQVLRLEDVPEPELRPGDVRLRVHAAALNFPDVLMCRGEYQVKPPLPFTPGVEVAGIVEDVGAAVEGVRPGERVIAIPTHGGYAEVTSAPAAGVFPVPEAMPFAAAAALHVVYQTGHLALHRRANLQKGETLLVHAGAGGVGSAAIQLGLAAGARVVATAGGPEKVEVCRKLGAHLAIDYREQDFVDPVKEFTDGRGADVVYDPVGGDTYDRSTKCIAFEGRILIIGFTGGRFAEARTNHVLIKNYSVVGVHWGLYNVVNPALVRATHDHLVRLFEAGRIDPLISERVTLDQVPAALARLGSRSSYGKIVCEP